MDEQTVTEAQRIAEKRGYSVIVNTLPSKVPEQAQQAFELWRGSDLIGPAGVTVASVIAEMDAVDGR